MDHNIVHCTYDDAWYKRPLLYHPSRSRQITGKRQICLCSDPSIIAYHAPTAKISYLLDVEKYIGQVMGTISGLVPQTCWTGCKGKIVGGRIDSGLAR